ncbi:uncharacterized protein LOC107048480 [Diachasma alloeum]|uniref:uncharacterized protein LOC107048480 n=1 Tax=Diachasma alloeum TaxID=454923 RepID=UPI0007384C25|nr:uncharacterized protein LOC107048480 [Diachasma alloeum]
MSTEDTTELDQKENDVRNETSYQVEEESPTTTSERSSAVSWNTPVSTTKSESSPSSVSWDTPRSNAGENTLVHSPLMSTIISPHDDPPPYSSIERQSLWSPLTHIRDLFCDDSHLSSNRSPELASLIENSTYATSTPAANISKSFRAEHPGNVKEENTFARKYGTICIVAFFIAFLMVLSLFAKFCVNSTFRL